MKGATVGKGAQSKRIANEVDWQLTVQAQNALAKSAREWLAESQSPVRIGLVLSGGGLRGASDVGVLQQLVEHDIPIDVIVGSSAGAIITAYYAAVGLTLSELVRDAENFQGRHLLAHCLNVRLRGRMFRTLSKLNGLIPERLAQLDSATFDRLHHSVRGIGVACHDVVSGRPCYFATGADCGLRLSDAVRASASIPGARCMASRASRQSRS